MRRILGAPGGDNCPTTEPARKPVCYASYTNESPLSGSSSFLKSKKIRSTDDQNVDDSTVIMVRCNPPKEYSFLMRKKRREK